MEKVTFTHDTMKDASDEWRLFLCPYCFKKNGPYSNLFRAVTSYQQQDKSHVDNEEQFNKYLVRDDIDLNRFWEDYSGSKPDIEDEDHVIISPAAEVEKDGIIPSKTFVLDDDGFPYALMEPDTTICTEKRICRACHNPLPYLYGKFPVIFIAVVGITGSGKTVYLSQLMNYIEDYLTKANLAAPGLHDELEAYVKKHEIRRNSALPKGTLPGLLTPPLPINVRDMKTKRDFTLVFYDIAGENCVKPDKMKKFGPFIVNANAILMIIDPEQFTGLFRLPVEDDDEEITRPSKVVKAMYNAFLAHIQGNDGNCTIPIAIALSKSDMLRDYYESTYRQSDIFKNIDYSSYESYRKGNRGLAYEDCRNVSEDLKELLKSDTRGETLINEVSASFDKIAYFAFSALNSKPKKMKDENGVETYILQDIPEQIRVEEPFYWLLYRLGIIPAIRRNSIDCKYCENINLGSVGGGKVDVPIEPPYYDKTKGKGLKWPIFGKDNN